MLKILVVSVKDLLFLFNFSEGRLHNSVIVILVNLPLHHSIRIVLATTIDVSCFTTKNVQHLSPCAYMGL